MFTLFDVLRLLGFASGAILGGRWGWQWFGALGALVGGLGGFFVGGILGNLPFIVGLKLVERKLNRMSNQVLREYLHEPHCLTPNLVLLELDSRGEDINSELPYVHALLASEDMTRRTAGWAALTSAFPHLVETIPNYRPTDATDKCQQACGGLLIAAETEPIPNRKSSEA